MKALPSQAELLQRFKYNPETGELTYKTAYGGRTAGTKKDGYIRIRHKGHRYRAHRIIWMMMTGEDPQTLNIDHINGDRSDNRWSNLRLATKAQNGANIARVTNCVSPWGFIVRASHEGKRHFVGTFKTQEEAQEAYENKCTTLQGEFSPY